MLKTTQNFKNKFIFVINMLNKERLENSKKSKEGHNLKAQCSEIATFSFIVYFRLNF